MSTGGYFRSQVVSPGMARFAVPIRKAGAESGVPGPVAKPVLGKGGCCHLEQRADLDPSRSSSVRSA